MNLTPKHEMYMASASLNARGPNATYIPPARVGSCWVCGGSRWVRGAARWVRTGGAGTPTRESLCLHFSVHTTWGFKTDTPRAYLDG